jgi:hypothetical protein
MADNVQITQGTGTTVATDDVAGTHYQQLKLVDGTLNSTTPIPGDGSGLSVQGQVAADAAVAGRPVLEGGRASDATPTAVSADGDAVYAWRNRRGAAKTVVVDDDGDSVMDGTTNSLRVNVVTGSATGTEYSEGTTALSITGVAPMWEDTSDIMRAVSAAKPFPVNVVTGGTAGVQYDEGATDATITGTVAMWEDTSDTMRAASVTKPLPVQVVTSPGGSVLPDPIVDSSAVAVPIKFASVNATADGDNTLVAAVTTKKLRVLGYALMATGAGTLQLKSAGSTVLGRIRSSGDGAGASYAGGIDAPACETATNEALVLNNPAGVDTVGHVAYIEKA